MSLLVEQATRLITMSDEQFLAILRAFDPVLRSKVLDVADGMMRDRYYGLLLKEQIDKTLGGEP